MLQDIFETLGFKDEEAKTYLTLLESGSAPAGALARTMGIPRPTLYGYLEKLIAAGLVSQSLYRGTKIFAAEPGEKLRGLYRRKIDELQKQQKALEQILPILDKKSGASLFRPRMQFFEGQEGIQNLFQDMLQYNNIQTYTMWPIMAMRDIITPDFLYYHNKIRIQRGIHIRAIWQRDQAKSLGKPNYLGSGGRYLRDIRLAPETMKFNMGFQIYADKVIFISSRKESFGFLIESAELVALLKAQHDAIWDISENFDIHPKGTKLFFEEVDEG